MSNVWAGESRASSLTRASSFAVFSASRAASFLFVFLITGLYLLECLRRNGRRAAVPCVRYAQKEAEIRLSGNISSVFFSASISRLGRARSRFYCRTASFLPPCIFYLYKIRAKSAGFFRVLRLGENGIRRGERT